MVQWYLTPEVTLAHPEFLIDIIGTICSKIFKKLLSFFDQINKILFKITIEYSYKKERGVQKHVIYGKNKLLN